ncbi:MAG: DUF4214 domain-containing protein [Candidatus Pacebacteria bacterium]|nr:DUF4214 domain-containing protein [Candidatus Paceibacterota bacterium]
MGNFSLTVPALADKFVDYRQQIIGNSYTWSWVRPLAQVRYLVIHHSAGPDTQTPDDIARYHVQNRGWGGVGYHFIITKDGTTYYVGDLTTARAHVYNYNHSALGVCLVGKFMNGKQPSNAQIHSAHELASQLFFRTPALTNCDGWEDLKGHSDFSATACPGDSWPSYKPKIIADVNPPTTYQKRRQAISELYQVVLGREPDQAGLDYHVKSDRSIDQIRQLMTESSEHRQLINRAYSFKKAQELANQGRALSAKGYWQIKNLNLPATDPGLNNVAGAYWRLREITELE